MHRTHAHASCNSKFAMAANDSSCLPAEPVCPHPSCTTPQTRSRPKPLCQLASFLECCCCLGGMRGVSAFVAMRPQLSGGVDTTGLPPASRGFKTGPGRAGRSLSHPCLPDLQVQTATDFSITPKVAFLFLSQPTVVKIEIHAELDVPEANIYG